MQRRQVLIGALGLIVAAGMARADVPAEVTLFGQKYALVETQLGGAYKNGLSLTLIEDDHNAGNIQFVEGATAEQDRLFGTNAFRDDATYVADQFYMLTGTDPSGVFGPAHSNLTQFFGGAQDKDRGGRIATVTYISDVDTGKKMDRNIALTTFTGDDHLRFYDLDTLTGDFVGDAVYSRVQRSILFDEADENAPYSGFMTGVLGPNGNLIFIGRGEGDGPQLSVLDPKQDNFFSVLTNVGSATFDQDTPYDIALDPWDMEALGGNEYLILASTPADLNADATQQVIYKVTITPPADLAAAEPESIQVQVTAADEIFATDENLEVTKDVLGSGTGISGMAVGRRPADQAPQVLYFRTRDGRLITAVPLPPA